MYLRVIEFLNPLYVKITLLFISEDQTTSREAKRSKRAEIIERYLAEYVLT